MRAFFIPERLGEDWTPATPLTIERDERAAEDFPGVPVVGGIAYPFAASLRVPGLGWVFVMARFRFRAPLELSGDLDEDADTLRSYASPEAALRAFRWPGEGGRAAAEAVAAFVRAPSAETWQVMVRAVEFDETGEV